MILIFTLTPRGGSRDHVRTIVCKGWTLSPEDCANLEKAGWQVECQMIGAPFANTLSGVRDFVSGLLARKVPAPCGGLCEPMCDGCNHAADQAADMTFTWEKQD